MELERIKEGVAALNGLGVKVAMVKVAKDDTPETLAKKFMEAVGKIPEESETELEEKHKEKWDALCAVALEAKKFLVEGAKKSTPPVPPKKGNASKTPSDSKERKSSKEKVTKDPKEKSRYGHRLGTESAVLDDLFFKGTSLEDASKVIKGNVLRVKGHLTHLRKDKGLKIEDNGKGVFKVKA